MIELLIILAIISLILTITHQNYTNKTDHQAFDYWYQQFELDLLYLQKKTMVTGQFYKLHIYPEQNKYEIRHRTDNSNYFTREIPKNWVVNPNTLSEPISFTPDGQIIHPGTMRIRTNDAVYSISFPFGKSRSYCVETK